jgi:hypothetical protein
MTTKREMYDTVVAEVERDYVHVFEHEMGEVPDTEDGYVQYELFDGLKLDSPTDAFSNFSVRDALMAKANADDKFAFVLSNKIIHSAKRSGASLKLAREISEQIMAKARDGMRTSEIYD